MEFLKPSYSFKKLTNLADKPEEDSNVPLEQDLPCKDYQPTDLKDHLLTDSKNPLLTDQKDYPLSQPKNYPLSESKEYPPCKQSDYPLQSQRKERLLEILNSKTALSTEKSPTESSSENSIPKTPTL